MHSICVAKFTLTFSFQKKFIVLIMYHPLTIEIKFTLSFSCKNLHSKTDRGVSLAADPSSLKHT